MSPARLLLVEDHPVFRMGLAQIIEDSADVSVAAEAADLAAARAALAGPALFDLAIIDITLPDGTGLDLLPDCLAAGVPALVLSMHDERLFAEQALAAGARGYLMKSTPPDALLAGLRQALAGERVLSPALTRALVADRLGERAGLTLADLTEREREVFEALGDGLSRGELADRLGIGTKTVETHLLRMRRKLELPGGAALRRLATLWHAAGRPHRLPGLQEPLSGASAR